MKAKQAGTRKRIWTAKEIVQLRRIYPNKTNVAVAHEMDRGLKSIQFKAAELGLKKSPKHRSRQARLVAIAALPSSEEMAARGQAGGLIGGHARAKKLTAKRRSEIAAKAGSAERRPRAQS